jgi:uncharacterized protein YjiS (DUF1127 family)
MTIVTIIHGTPAFLARLGRGFLNFYARIQQARLRAQTFEALAGLSDAQLAQRGLKREEIAYAVLAAGKLRRS